MCVHPVLPFALLCLASLHPHACADGLQASATSSELSWAPDCFLVISVWIFYGQFKLIHCKWSLGPLDLSQCPRTLPKVSLSPPYSSARLAVGTAPVSPVLPFSSPFPALEPELLLNTDLFLLLSLEPSSDSQEPLGMSCKLFSPEQDLVILFLHLCLLTSPASPTQEPWCFVPGIYSAHGTKSLNILASLPTSVTWLVPTHSFKIESLRWEKLSSHRKLRTSPGEKKDA